MDDIKLFAKNENELEFLIQAVRIYSKYLMMEYVIEKYGMLITNTGKQQMTEQTKLPNQEKIGMPGENDLLELGNIWCGHYQTSGDERKKSKKSISEKRKHYSKPIYRAENSSKE